jgi:hypothetical protein
LATNRNIGTGLVINLIGLTLGFSAVMALAVMLYQFVTTNNQFSHKDRLYYVKLHSPEGGDGRLTPFPYLDAVLRACPDVEAGTHVQGWNPPWLKAGHKESQDATWFVDTGFLRVFSYPLESGNPLTALRGMQAADWYNEFAENYFLLRPGADTARLNAQLNQLVQANFAHDYPLVGIFVVAGLAIILLAGSWPVLHFGSLRPMDAIKGKITGAGNGKGQTYVTRNMFITLQFVLATIFIGISVILNSQIRHMRSAAVGFDQGQVLVASPALRPVGISRRPTTRISIPSTTRRLTGAYPCDRP